MCSNCKNTESRHNAIREAMSDLQELRQDLDTKVREAIGNGGWDCCDGSRLALCNAVIEAISYLGVAANDCEAT